MPVTLKPTCCIAGGGPAGMMLGFLLARMGVDVVVLEKHADFLRDFRGDTIHPSTLDLIYELGLLDEFLKCPHQNVRGLVAYIGGVKVDLADFTHLPTHCKFLAFMPQWDFLNFLVDRGKRYPNLRILMRTEATDIIEEVGRIAGLVARTDDGDLEIRAHLTVGADGRRSTVRERAGLQAIDLGAPMDVLWMRLTKKPSDPGHTLGRVEAGKMMVMLDRDEYWQCGFIIPKGHAGEMRKQGIEMLRADIAGLAPFLSDRVEELRDWNDVSLLTVKIDRLPKWFRPGLLCIGDAAHAMSPIGGVGINLAIQDAVAAANILGAKLKAGNVSIGNLEMVQRRRQFPTRATQKIQVFLQNNVVTRILSRTEPIAVPWPLKLLNRWPLLRRIPGRMIGMGFRPEHVRTPETLGR